MCYTRISLLLLTLFYKNLLSKLQHGKFLIGHRVLVDHSYDISSLPEYAYIATVWPAFHGHSQRLPRVMHLLPTEGAITVRHAPPTGAEVDVPGDKGERYGKLLVGLHWVQVHGICERKRAPHGLH